MSEHALTTLLNDAVHDAPPRDWTLDQVRTAARARTARRRTWGALGGVAVAASVAAIAFALGGPVVQPAAPSAPAAGSGVAVGFPVGSAIEAAMSAFPSGVEVGELPVDIAWRDGTTLTIPIVVDGTPATLELVAADAGCTATSVALTSSTLDAVSSAVCTARQQALSSGPAGLPSGGGPAS
jgi:hypothetical protein